MRIHTRLVTVHTSPQTSVFEESRTYYKIELDVAAIYGGFPSGWLREHQRWCKQNFRGQYTYCKYGKLHAKVIVHDAADLALYKLTFGFDSEHVDDFRSSPPTLKLSTRSLRVCEQA